MVLSSHLSPSLQSDCQVHLQPQVSPPNLEEHLSTIQAAQAPSQMNRYRQYLSVARQLDYSISEEVTKVRPVAPQSECGVWEASCSR